MLEAINSVLSNVPLARASVPSALTSPTPSQAKSDYISVESANYSSRFIDLYSNSRRTVLKIRDSATGESLRQFPTESQIRAYQHAQSTKETAKALKTGRVAPSAVEQKALTDSAPDTLKPEAFKALNTPPPPSIPAPVIGSNLSEKA